MVGWWVSTSRGGLHQTATASFPVKDRHRESVRFHATRAVFRRRALTARVSVCRAESWFDRCASSGPWCLLRQPVCISLEMRRSSRYCSRRRHYSLKKMMPINPNSSAAAAVQSEAGTTLFEGRKGFSGRL